MKKSIKIILCLSLVAIMCMGLCSCDALDDAKKNHAVYSEDYKTVTYNGDVYNICPVELYESLDAYVSETYNINYDTYLHIAEPDVPVLLASMYGDVADTMNKGKIISISTEVDEEEINNEKYKLFYYTGDYYTEVYYNEKTTMYDYCAYYIADEIYDEIISVAEQYKETNYGTYNEDKSKIIVNDTTYIKAPEDVHKKYDNLNKSIFDIFEDDYNTSYYYITDKNSNTPSTLYEVLYDDKILYSHDESYYDDYYDDYFLGDYYYEEKMYLDDTYYSTYDDVLEEYNYYVYYFREDV